MTRALPHSLQRRQPQGLAEDLVVVVQGRLVGPLSDLGQELRPDLDFDLMTPGLFPLASRRGDRYSVPAGGGLTGLHRAVQMVDATGIEPVTPSV